MGRAAAYIRTVLAIFIRDMKRLGRNPIALVVVIGVCILPALYAWYTVAAFWDPYQNTESIEVAVVNEDRGAESPLGTRIDVGSQVVDDLKDNHQLGWRFVDRNEALEGVESGRYYGAIVMPEDFSEGFVSVFSGNFDKPQIDFYVNEKLTGSGVKVAETGAKDLEKEIDQQFVETVSANVLEITQRAGLTVKDDTDQSQDSLAKGTTEAVNALQSTRQLLSDIGGSLEQTERTLTDARETQVALQDDMPDLDEALSQSEEALEQARTALASAANGASANLASASVALSGAEAAAQTAAGRISGQVQHAQSAAGAAAADAQGVLDATGQALGALRAQAQKTPGNAQLESAISDLETANERAADTLDALQAAESGLATSFQEAQDATAQLDQAARNGLSSMRDGATLLQTKAIPKLDESLACASDVLGRLRGVEAALKPSIQQGVKALESLEEAVAQTRTICEQSDGTLANMESQLQDTLADLNALRTSQGMQRLTEFLGADTKDMATLLASPVSLDTVAVYPGIGRGAILHQPGAVGVGLHPYGHGAAARGSKRAACVHSQASLLRSLAHLCGAGRGTRLGVRRG